jgi:hypothetical protein
MITVESHTATCGDCWARGNQRVYEQQPCNDADREGESEMATLDCESDAYGSDNSSEDEEDYFSAEEFLSPSPYLRPATPQLYYEQHPAWWPVSDDNNFDLTRTCDPVDPVSMRRDYRARRQRTTPSQYSSDGKDSFVSCEGYLDEETTDEENSVLPNKEDDICGCP